ncbi:MAG: hypothetical protein FWH06_04095 [Oscillospiraceae bacterium]|nr:hypothetical protein [Oscillospiraceae bacterium]
MSTIRLTFEQIENLFRDVVCKILDISDTGNAAVRFPYGSSAAVGNAPGFTRDMDVCFVYVIPADDGYGQQYHISYTPDPGSDLLTRVDEHTDIYDVQFTFHGPNSFERSRSMKDGLYRNDVRLLLKQSGFFLKAGIPPIIQMREVREGEWWRRYDVRPTFYSYVRIETPGFMEPIEKASIAARQ